MIKVIFTLCMYLVFFDAFSQKQANIWYFGNGAGLDFNGTCTPSVLTNGQIDGFEGCVTMCDKITGQLLFYTNSEQIWNSSHQPVPNSTLVLPNGKSISQVVAIEKPGSPSRYYILTTQVQSQGVKGLKLAELDMGLNVGLGGIVFKDSIICADTMVEALTTTRHSNGNDIWVVAHKNNSKQFLSYLVSSSGVGLSPIVSTIGKRRSYSNIGYADEIGESKFSPDGNKIVSVTFQNPYIELFDFNNTTGQITNVITLPELGAATNPTNFAASGFYGASFSSNNQFLYVSKVNNTTGGMILQYDISSNDSATINNSKVILPSTNTSSTSAYSLKLGPDKKIYVGHHSSTYIGVINSPDSSGPACNYIENGIFLNGKLSGWGLNNLMEYSSYCPFNLIATGTDFLENKNIKTDFYPNPFSETATLKFANENNTVYQLYIYNNFGQTVLAKTIESSEIKIEKKELYPGYFFFKLVSSNHVESIGKFFVE